MPARLIRYQQEGHLHFLTFSCFERRPYFRSIEAMNLFQTSLETMRQRYNFAIFGYVIMPEHVHLLLSEPDHAPLAKAIQALKLSVATQRSERPFWLHRYYDFNVFTQDKRIEKLRYMHRNPARRALVETPEAWPWSSFAHYQTGAQGSVQIQREWTEPNPDTRPG